MAVKSREQPPLFGNAERQVVTNEIHAAMLEAEEAQVLCPTWFTYPCTDLICYNVILPALGAGCIK